MRDAKHFGYELAERMVNRMRARNVKAEQALRRVASEVAGRANTMVLAEGKHRGDVVGWVGEVQLACVERIAEHLSAADDDFCHSDLHQPPQKLAEVPSVSPGD